MRIGLIADTHIPEAGPDIWPQVYDAFLGVRPAGPKVELILHAGDIHVPEVLDRLEAVTTARVVACRGNGDDGDGGRLIYPDDDERVRPHQVLDVMGFRIGVTHALVLPEMPPYFAIEAAMKRKFGQAVDVVVHGDTHVADIQVVRGIVCVNPGSPTFPRNMRRSLGTIGFLEIDSSGIRPWVHQLD